MKYIYHYKWPVSDIVVTSFIEEELLKLHAIMPVVRVGLIFDEGDRIEYDPAIFKCIVIPMSSLNPDVVREAHARSVTVYVYTVNEPNNIRYAKECGVDGIISDVPDRVKSVLLS